VADEFVSRIFLLLREFDDLPRERMEELWNLSKLRKPVEAAHAK